jgi:hypothetical protein
MPTMEESDVDSFDRGTRSGSSKKGKKSHWWSRRDERKDGERAEASLYQTSGYNDSDFFTENACGNQNTYGASGYSGSAEQLAEALGRDKPSKLDRLSKIFGRKPRDDARDANGWSRGDYGEAAKEFKKDRDGFWRG